MALGRGHGGHGGHHGGGGRRFGGGRGGFGPGWWGGGPWYDYDYGPLVIVDEDDDEEKRRIALIAAQAAANAVAAKQAAVKGLGIFRPHDRMAHPLGSATGPVPSACWSAPSFKDCQARVMTKAQGICSEGQTYPNAAWKTYDDCVNDYTATFVGPSAESVTCVSTYCPKAAGASAPASTAAGGTYPWHVYSAATVTLQKATNDALTAAGYCPLLEDGKLGSGTCGARKMLKESGAVPGMSWPSTCQSFATPSKPPCTAPAVASAYPAPSAALPGAAPMTLTPAQQASIAGGGFNWKTAALIGGGIALAGLVFYAVRKKQAEAA